MRLKFRARMVALGMTVILFVVYAFWASGNAPAELPQTDAPYENFLVLTVSTDDTSTYRRFVRSAKVNDLPLKVLGFGQKWRGWGDKLALVKEELEHHKHLAERIVLFCDSNDALINARAHEFLGKFKQIGARILFGAEANPWPDPSLAHRYPQPGRGKKYLNSGMFIGYASDLHRMLTSAPFTVETNDQLYYTHIYLNEKLRHELRLQLDHRSQIFQNMEGGENNVELRFEGENQYIYNKDHGTRPLVIHTPGNCKFLIHIIKNYIPSMWQPGGGCSECLEGVLDLSSLKEEHYPSVVIAVFIEKTSSLAEFLDKIQLLDYPKERISLMIDNESNYKIDVVTAFIRKYGADYESVELVAQERSNKTKRDMGIDRCVEKICDFYFSVESAAHLDNPQTLRLLIEQNRQVVAPILFDSKGQKNFRGVDAFSDYCKNTVKIIKDQDRGLLSVGVVSKCYLIRGDVIHNSATRPFYGQHELNDPDVVFSELMDTYDVELFASNRYEFGHLAA